MASEDFVRAYERAMDERATREREKRRAALRASILRGAARGTLPSLGMYTDGFGREGEEHRWVNEWGFALAPLYHVDSRKFEMLVDLRRVSPERAAHITEHNLDRIDELRKCDLSRTPSSRVISGFLWAEEGYAGSPASPPRARARRE